MNSLFILCSFFALAFGEQVNINEAVDSFIKRIDPKFISKFIPKSFPPFSWNGGSHKGGRIEGIDTLKRTGNCWATKNDTGILYEHHIGFDVLKLIQEELNLNGQKMSAIQVVENCSFRVELFFNKTCSVSFTNVKLEDMGLVINYSSNPDYNEKDFTLYFEVNILEIVNNALDSLRPTFSEYCTKFLCGMLQGIL